MKEVASMSFRRAVEIASMKQLLTREQPESADRPSLTLIESVSEAGSYGRKAPFRFDVTDLADDQRSLMAEYVAKNEQEHGTIYHVKLECGTVVGQGTVITCNSEIVKESAAEFLAHGLTPDGMRKSSDGQLYIKKDADLDVKRPSVLLKRPWYANFGHWLVDSAALCSLLSKISLPPDWQIVIAQQQSRHMRRIVYETLDILVPGVQVIEHSDNEVWSFSELHYVSPIHVPPLFKLPEGLSCLRALILRRRIAFTKSRFGIYVRRASGSTRQLVNETEVIQLCERFGVEVVSPERFSLEDQAALFHRANIVVGVKGAALTNAIFCSPRAHIVVMSPADFPDPFFWDLIAQSGLYYSEIFGKLITNENSQGQNPFTIDLDRLRSILEACITQTAE